MLANEIRDLSVEQLQDELEKMKKEQLNLRFQKSSGQMENSARIREVRRIVARIKTIHREKQLVNTN